MMADGRAATAEADNDSATIASAVPAEASLQLVSGVCAKVVLPFLLRCVVLCMLEMCANLW